MVRLSSTCTTPSVVASLFAVLCIAVPSAATPAGIADFIADGIGLAPGSSATSPTLPKNTGSQWANATSSSKTTLGANRKASNILVTAPAPTSTGINNASMAGGCWDQWASYYNNTAFDSLTYTPFNHTITITTVTSSVYFTSHYNSGLTTTLFTVIDWANPNDHDFPIGTQTLSFTTDFTGWATDPVSTGAPFTTTITTHWTDFNATITPGGPSAPSCTLPPVVPQCQAQWDHYYAVPNLTKPFCSQASIDAAQCSEEISREFRDQRTFGNPGLSAYKTVDDATDGVLSFWPTTSSFAPGCTLGCQQCGIRANTVQLYYWPPATATAASNHTMTAMGSQLVPSGSVVVTAVVDNITMTSPTVYISYASLYASNSCSGVGKTYKNTVIPISNSQALSSLAYRELHKGGFEPGHFVADSWDYATVPFDYADLQEPVPESIFQKLPSCHVASVNWAFAGQPADKFKCEHAKSYAPLIALPENVRDIDPAWASCSAYYEGAYDPPKTLKGVTAIQTATLPSLSHTTAASPSSTIGAGLPSKTADETTPTAEPVGSKTANGDPPAQTQSGSETFDPVTFDPVQSPTKGQADSTKTNEQASPTEEGPTDPSKTDNQASPTNDEPSKPSNTQQDQPGQESPASVPQASNAKPTNVIVISGVSDPKPTKTVSPSNALGVLTAALSHATQGSPGVTVAIGETATVPGVGTVVAQSSALVIDGSTQHFSNVGTDHTEGQATAVFTAGGQTFTAVQPAQGTDGSGRGGNTPAGAETTIISSSETAVIIGSNTLVFATASSGSVYTSNGQTYTAVDPIGGGGGGHSLPPVVSSARPIITVGGTVVTANSNSQYIVGSQTLEQGGPAITAAGTTYSIVSAGSGIVVDGTTTDIAVPSSQIINGSSSAKSTSSTSTTSAKSPFTPEQPIKPSGSSATSLSGKPILTVAMAMGVAVLMCSL